MSKKSKNPKVRTTRTGAAMQRYQQTPTDVRDFAIAVGHGVDGELMLKLAMSFGAKPLLVSASQGNYSAVKALLDNGGDVTQCDREGATPLMIASMRASSEIVKLLFEHGAPVYPVDADGNSALHYAACERRLETCRLLLENEADLTATNARGETALHAAARAESYECCLFLIVNGADPNARDIGGNTAVACSNECQMALAEYERAKLSVNRLTSESRPHMSRSTV